MYPATLVFAVASVKKYFSVEACNLVCFFIDGSVILFTSDVVILEDV